MLPQAAPSVTPLSLPAITLTAGHQYYLRLDHLAWSPNRSRFGYALNSTVTGPVGGITGILRVRDQLSQLDREMALPPGTLNRLWWLDDQNLALVMETGRSATGSPLAYVLYRLNPDTGSRAELTRFPGEVPNPQIHSLKPRGQEIFFLDADGGSLNLHVLDGLSGRQRVYPTGLSGSAYDGYSAHQLAAPDADQVVILAADATPPTLGGAGMTTEYATLSNHFDTYRLNRSSGKLSKVSVPTYEAGAYTLSPGGRYLLGPSSVRDLLGDRPAVPLQTIGKPQWWSEGVIYAFESAARPPLAGTWIDAATGKVISRSAISFDQAGLQASPAEQASWESDVALTPQAGGYQVASGSRTWFAALLPEPSRTSPEMAALGITQAAVASIGPSQYVPLHLSSTSASVRQQLENSPLHAESSGPLRLKVYYPDGRKGGFFLLLEILVPK